MAIHEAKKGEEKTILFALIDTASPPNLISGQAANVGVQLRDEDGAASEVVTIQEQGTSGWYEARFSPSKGKDSGFAYALSLQSPVLTTDGALLLEIIYSRPSVSYSGISGAFLTTLANVKQFLEITESSKDALLTNLIARVTRIFEAWCDRRFAQAAYQEIHDGSGRDYLMLRNDPSTLLSAVYESRDQVWDATTQIALANLILDKDISRVILKSGVFAEGRQNVRVDHTAGYAIIPADVEQLAIEMVSRTFQNRKDLNVVSLSLKDGSVTKRLASRFAGELLEDLAPYVRRRAA